MCSCLQKKGETHSKQESILASGLTAIWYILCWAGSSLWASSNCHDDRFTLEKKCGRLSRWFMPLSQSQKIPPQAIRPETFNLRVQGHYNSIALFTSGGNESGVERKAPHYPHVTACSADGLANDGDCGNLTATLPFVCLQKGSSSVRVCFLYFTHIEKMLTVAQLGFVKYLN